MFVSGSEIASNFDNINNKQIQPNGIDLTLGELHTIENGGEITTDGKEIGDRKQIKPKDGMYDLGMGVYVVEYGEVISVPDDAVGFVYPRSSLIRNGCMLNTAVWDAGYEGRGEGLLNVNVPIQLEAGCRIGQFVCADAETVETYDGDYQGENI